MVKHILDKYEKKYAQELLHFAGGYPDWTHTYHHAGFDIVSNRILEIVREKMKKETQDMFDDYCFWVTGHSMGGGVANIVGAELLHSLNGINSRTDNVYCYTFAAPNTFYLTDNKYERDNRGIEGKKITGNYREPHGVKYRCIFNIVNEDDFVPEVPMKDCNWTKYGRTATISFNSNKYEIDEIIKREDKYRINRSVTKDYIHNQYKGNTETIKDIVGSFNKIFEDDPENMRYSAYKFNDDDYASMYFSDLTVPKNTRPYQKLDTIGEESIQYQMPAYFMQYIAYCMHGGFSLIIADSSDAGFFFEQFSKKYINTKNALIDQKKLILLPHYLETYYLLTKKIILLDFK